MSPNEYIVDKIYNIFEEQRKKHKSYRDDGRFKKEEYKELIKILLEKEEIKEVELMLKASELGLSKTHYDVFMSIMKNYLGFIVISTDENGFKTVKITNEL